MIGGHFLANPSISALLKNVFNLITFRRNQRWATGRITSNGQNFQRFLLKNRKHFR